MPKLSTPARKLFLMVIALAAVVFAGGALICAVSPSMSLSDMLPIAIGALIFLVINIARIYLLEYQVKRISDTEDPSRGRLFAFGQGFLRLALLAAGLVGAALLHNVFGNHYALFAAMVTAFSWNLAVYALRFARLDDDEYSIVGDEGGNKAEDNDKNDSDENDFGNGEGI